MKPTIRIAAITILVLCTAGAFAQEDDSAPQPVPNHIKYQDSKPHAKAAGSVAVVETRALISRWGSTELEVTTGNLDTGEPSATANITKVQLELNGTTTNFNHLNEGDSFVLPLPPLARNTPFAAHVNVRGLNSGSTEVVRVEDKVRLRPDLRIVAVDAPSAVRVNQPFSIVATIQELNGDTGARTNCVLTDWDGHVEYDRADNIWVDAGDTVQCMFSHSLSTIPGQTFVVRLERTRPDDWDSSEGERYAIGILGVTTKQWEITAKQRTIHQTGVETYSGDPEHPYENESVDTLDLMHFSAVIDQPIDLDTMTMSIEESTDGNVIYAAPTVRGFPPGASNDRGCKFSDRRHSLYTVCRFEGGLAVDVRTVGSSTLYVSHFWTAQFDPESGQNVYTRRTMRMNTRFGTPLRYGNTYQMRISLRDAENDSWELSPFLNLIPYDTPVEHSSWTRGEEPNVWHVNATYHEYGKTGSDSRE